MTELITLLHELFQQYGLAGLLIGFLLLGPGLTLLSLRTIRAQAEVKAQALVNEFAQKERQRADRLEEQLRCALRKLESTEQEVARLRLKLSETQGALAAVPGLRRQVRRLTQRVREMKAEIEDKTQENADLRQRLEQREGEIQDNQQRLRELEEHIGWPEHREE